MLPLVNTLLQSNSIDLDLIFKQFQIVNLVVKNGCGRLDCTTASDYNEDHKDSLFITTPVDDFVFGGYKHGLIRWVVDYKWPSFGDHMPPQINKETGFAVFNGKNNTAYNE
jgi:hypothetical protein